MVKYTKITEAEGATILAQLNAGSSWVDIAKHVGHSERILKRWLAANGHAHPLRRLTNAQVADILRPWMEKNVRLGQRYAAGELLRQGYRVPREQLRRVIRLIDPVGNIYRRHLAIPRVEANWGASGRMYSSDGLEKNVNTYGLQVNSLIDAFSKMILSAKVSSDECVTTVMDDHKDGLRKYGWGRFWRFDRGTENNGLAEAQNFARGDGSAIRGVSTRNITIERLNKEMQKWFAHFTAFHSRVLRTVLRCTGCRRDLNPPS